MQPLDLPKLLALPALPSYLDRVQQELERVVSVDEALIGKPLQRILQVHGKRLRPTLVFAAASLQKPETTDKVVAAGVAVELLHIASLIHDDIIDHAEARWNIPTIHTQEGMPSAILSGDYLFALACEQATTISPEAGQILANAFAALCRGQALEIADDHNLNRTEQDYFTAIKGKTAALMSAACHLGALCGNYSDDEVQALTDYGETFGMSFQILDDVLDFIADPNRFGKPVGNDVREGNYTLPLILALQSEHAKEAKTCLAKSPEKLSKLLHALGTIDQTIQAAQSYSLRAAKSLAMIGSSFALENLKQFPAQYTSWSLDTLTKQTSANNS